MGQSPLIRKFWTSTGFPLGLENLENLEKWEGIFQSGKSQGILNRLEKSGKIAKNTGKLREFEINIIWYFYILFLVIFKWTVYCFLKWIKFSVKQTNTKKILENWKKYWKSQGKVWEFCQSGKVGTLFELLCIYFIVRVKDLIQDCRILGL